MSSAAKAHNASWYDKHMRRERIDEHPRNAYRRIQLTLASGVLAAFTAFGFLLHGFSMTTVRPNTATLVQLIAPNPARPLSLPPPPPFQFPDGGEVLMPNFHLVALYGEPDTPALGALGEQSLDASLARVKALAASYQPFSATPVMPALEIIATVASATPTDNGDYSTEVSPAVLQPWVTAARKQGVYIVLDLQPGRSDFLTQAKEYAGLLAEPNVGLALDPEWRLAPGQVPLEQIGSVSIDEVNAADDWLAALTAQDHLPQKLFVLHEFRLSMLPDRQALHTAHKELAYVIQMDGQGPQNVKASTWANVVAAPPPNVQFGWKNFYTKDTPVLSPQQTMALAPQPWYISYE